MMSRGGGGSRQKNLQKPSAHGREKTGNGNQSRGKPTISQLGSGQNRFPVFNSSSVAGAGYNSKQLPKPAGPTGGAGSLNSNVFNIPKYGSGGLGGGIGGGLGSGIGSYGSLGGGSGMGLISGMHPAAGSRGSANK